jgi:hypothetical protein
MTTAEGEEIIALPKREQTLEEMERTKQFALEVFLPLFILSSFVTLKFCHHT